MLAPTAKTVFMFSGQGSQYFQMGRELFDQNPAFRACMLQLDEMVRQLSGNSVLETLYFAGRCKSSAFDQTLLTHPAIFMVEYALARCLIDDGLIPDINMGVSLGSFAAATVSGFIEVETALAAVLCQAKTFADHCEPGGMVAVLADPALFETDFFAENSELAAVNFSSHFVISAPRTNLARIEARLLENSVSHQRLPVSLAFHSRWIDPARAPFESFMRSVRRGPGRLPLMCCEQGAVLPTLADNYFWRIARRPIRFREAVAQLEKGGANRYIDLGPAGTLATFLKYGLSRTSRSTIHPILTPYGCDTKNLKALQMSSIGWHR